METPERLENCPPTPEEVLEGSSGYLEEARVSKLKLSETCTCVICYSSVKEGQKCFPENCLHIFCFECLCKWSRQKNQCPLCKKVFDIIIHNVKSKTEYDRYQVIVSNRSEASDSPINLTDLVIPIVPIDMTAVYHRVNFLTNHSPRRRFTYRTRFEATMEQNERIQELFRTESDYARLTPAEWRRYIYDRHLYALPLPDVAGRHRECSADFYRENPAQTHRLIPWLNRELVVLMQPNHTNAIPTILEEMREQLCVHDIQSRAVHDYFVRYLHDKTEHFIHEFYNFAISPYDIVGYDRNVDYRSRDQPPEVTVEISSNESSDGEVQVIDEGSAGSSSTVIQISPEATTEVVLETTGAQEESCRINDLQVEISENVPPASSEVVVESSDSECQFVLALKPPHLRTPEQVSLDSASDSDVVYIPNDPNKTTTLSSSDSDDTEDNKPLSETRKQLKSELFEEEKYEMHDIKTDEHIPEPNMRMDDNMNLFNFGASTSTASLPDENVPNQKIQKLYYQPKRKRFTGKGIFEESSSESSSSSSSTSDDEWQDKLASSTSLKNNKSSRHRRKSSKKQKKRRVSSTIVSNPKPLSELPSSEEARDDDDEAMGIEHPRIKSVIIKKQDDQHYIENAENSNSNSNSDISAD